MPTKNLFVRNSFLQKQNIFTIFVKVKNILINNFSIINVLIILIALFYFFNVKDGHDWGGDFSMYIMNAKNIVQFEPYSQTGYIYNEDLAIYGPPAYPPVFPLMLSPFVALWGVNLKLLKLIGIFCFVGFLFFFSKEIIPEELSLYSKVLLIIVIGFYPFYFLLSESILSDFPFLFFSFIALNLINSLSHLQTNKFKSLFDFSLVGIFIYLAYGTRSIGIVLIPVVVIYVLLKTRKFPLGLLISVIFPILLIIIQNLIIPQTGKYFDQIPNSFFDTLSTIFESTIYYISLFIGIFQFNNFYLQGLVFIILSEGFVIGLIMHLKRGFSSYDLFFIFYIAILLVWPSYQFLRFLVPVIPLYFLFIIEGFDFIVKKVNNSVIKIILPLIFLGFISINYIQTYMNIFPRPISAIERAETQELFQFIKSKTNEEDVILFFKPRVLALFTNRKSLAMKFPDPNGDALGKMNGFGVDYVILNKNHSIEYQPELKHFINNHPLNFNLLFENYEFNIYKVLY